MEFSPELVKRVAKFAKINLSEEKIIRFSQQFADIAEVISKLQQVDTTGVTPIHNPSKANTLMRQDIVNDGNYVKDIMQNAPKHTLNCFVVPKVVE